MLPNRRVPALLVALALLGGTACLPPGADASRNAALRSFLDEWKGRPFEAFQQATGWKPASVQAFDKGGLRIVAFSAPGSGTVSETSMTYHSVTSWSDGQPGLTTTGGPNQPVGVPPNPYTVRTETIRLGTPPPGCQVRVWVDSQGLIQSWSMRGGDCFRETLDRLK